ncbi:MAG TPA: DUF481 domain-containing protein [Ignavibacteriaceae bacterium]|nr:DUF481 domain-containing protein [Ignavibacteriaceae bacterium]
MRSAAAIIIIFTFTLLKSSYSQVNTEKFRKESEKPGFSGNASAAAGLASGNSEFVKVNSGLRLDYSGKGYTFFLVGNYDFQEANNDKVVNKGFAHLRNIIALSPEFFLELFLQKEFDQFILLKDRNLAGAGLRVDLVRLISDTTSSPAQVFIGSGLMYENEYYDILLSPETNLVRSTNYLTFKWRITGILSFITINYFQFDIERIHDFRFITDTSLSFLIMENLSFDSTASFRFDNEPVPDVKKFDLELMNGITFSF